MTNWRSILSWRTLEWVEGARVRVIVDNHRSSGRLDNLDFPFGIEGTIVRGKMGTNYVIVRLDWEYPTPSDYIGGANEKGWTFHIDELELL